MVRGGLVIGLSGEESRLVPLLGVFSADAVLPIWCAACALVPLEMDIDLLRGSCLSKPTLMSFLGTWSHRDEVGEESLLVGSSGVLLREIQTPSTSIPLSMARIPNGTSSLPLLRPADARRRSLICRCMACSCLSCSATAESLRRRQWAYSSFTHPRHTVTTIAHASICKL